MADPVAITGLLPHTVLCASGCTLGSLVMDAGCLQITGLLTAWGMESMVARANWDLRQQLIIRAQHRTIYNEITIYYLLTRKNQHQGPPSALLFIQMSYNSHKH